MSKIVGIDLGTTNSVVAVMEGKEVKVIPNKHGSNLTPSVVGINENGERLVGQLAKRQAIMNPRNTVYSIKRFMGRRRNEVGQEEKMFPYEVIGSPEEAARVRLRGKVYSPQEISAMVLSDLKETAETYLGEKVLDAVITCPAYFNDGQRRATEEAGRIAGFNVKRVFPEPTAAALAFGLGKKKGMQKIAVYDLGGGTFDISILEVDNDLIEVRAVNGNTHLGGDDFDKRLIDYVCDEFRHQKGMDLRRDPMALQRLKEACERAKCDLSTMLETTISLPYIAGGDMHLDITITRAKLEQLIGDLLESSLGPVENALKDAKMSKREIDEVVLVGGSTRIPMVQRLVREYFGKEPNRSVNPDEVVAVGAAIQAGIISGHVKDILLVDVTPLTLGIKVEGGIMVPLIPRNSRIPNQKSQVFSTASDNQPAVTIEVYQGERPMAEDNRKLGTFDLDGIPPAPRGVPQIEVKFDLDANGILSVTAKDTGTGKERNITIKGSTGLSKDEVDRMVKDSESYSETDKARKELAEARNHADRTVYAVEKFLRDNRDKVGGEKDKVEKALERLKQAKGSEDVAEIKKAIEGVTDSMHDVSRKLYEQAAKQRGGAGAPDGGTPPPPEAGGGKKGEKIIDADFESK
jgi:molecular chaperone DnaK